MKYDTVAQTWSGGSCYPLPGRLRPGTSTSDGMWGAVAAAAACRCLLSGSASRILPSPCSATTSHKSSSHVALQSAISLIRYKRYRSGDRCWCLIAIHLCFPSAAMRRQSSDQHDIHDGWTFSLFSRSATKVECMYSIRRASIQRGHREASATQGGGERGCSVG